MSIWRFVTEVFDVFWKTSENGLSGFKVNDFEIFASMEGLFVELYRLASALFKLFIAWVKQVHLIGGQEI